MKNPLAIAAALLTLVTQHPSVAAERLGRLTIEVKVTGQEQWQNKQGTDKATVRFDEKVSYSTVVKTDGELVDFNSKDPNYAQQQMAKAAQTAQAVTKAQGQKPITQTEFKDRVQQGQAACKGEQKCLMDLALKASEWSNQLLAGQSAAAPAESGSGNYLNYFGFPDCGSKMHIVVNDVTEGSYADVQGAVPFSNKTTADYSGDANERLILCSQTNLVVDTQQKVFYSDGLLIRGVKGTSMTTDRGKTTQSNGDVPLKGEAFAWVSEQLRKAPLSGTRKATLQLTNPKGGFVPFVAQGKGTANIELTWRFDEL